MTSASRPCLSVVVPCYNEQDSLAALYTRVCNSCVESVGNDFELVLVNDGSRDATWQMMTSLAASDSRVVAVNLTRNHGHQLALSAGLAIARGERTLVLDADLQDPPELLPQMMRAMDEGADVVYGQRIARPGESLFKRLTAKTFYRVLRRLVDVDIPADAGDFRLISRRALDAFNALPERQRFVRGMIAWIGFRQVALPYAREPRYAGVSNYPLGRMISLALSGVTSFSTRPLRVASVTGLMFALAGFLAALWSIVAWARGETLPGWTSVIVVVLLLGGVQLIVIGILGEYVGRLYMEAKGRPAFMIESVVRGGLGHEGIPE